MNREEIARYYDYPRKAIDPNVRVKEGNERWERKVVEFELQLPPELDDESVELYRRLVAEATSKFRVRNLSLEYTVRFDYFRPRSEGLHPLVVISPPLGGDTFLAGDFARYFASRGMCAVLVHRKRSTVDADDGVGQIECEVRKSVLRVRQALDWALQQPDVDASRVASFGVSYGAIINTIAAGAEPRIRYHIFALGGGDLPNIILSTTEPRVRRQAAKVARAHGWSREELYAQLERELKSDPLNSAPLLDPENVLMVVAQYDTVVGTRYENLLWKRMGKPERIVVPLGHYTTAIALPFIKGQALQFLQEKFGMLPEPVNDESVFLRHGSKRY